MLKVIFFGILIFTFLKSIGFAEVLKLPHRAEKLPNGLKVFMVKYPSPGVVAYQLAVRAGSRNEVEKGKTGFAHFFEHLMFRGSKNRTGKELSELYTKLGNENNAWTWFDMTDYHGLVSSENLPQILEAEADRFMNLSFSEKVLRDEAGAVLGEFNKNAAQPESILEEKLLETAFKKHPYSHTTMGYKEDVVQFTERYNDVWPFFKRYYRPENITLVLVGDLDFKRTMGDIRREFGDWKNPKTDTVTIPKEPQQTEARKAEVSIDKPTQTRAVVAYKTPAFTTANKEAASLQLLAEILFSITSDFQKEFRFEKKWIDSIAATNGETTMPMQSIDPGLWVIYFRLSDEGSGKEGKVTQAIEKMIADIHSTPPTKEKLDAAKKRFKNGALTSWFSSPDSLASIIAGSTLFEPDIGILDRMLEKIDQVTPADISAFAKKYLKDTNKTVVTLKGN